MTNLYLAAVIGTVLAAGVALGPLLTGQLQVAQAQGNTTVSSNMTGNMTGGNATMSGNMTGGNATSGGSSVTISPGSSSPSNGKNFVPDTLNVKAGTTVTWTNGDTTLHTVTSGSPEGGESGKVFDSSYLAAGKTFQHMFDKAGSFDYYCTLHPFMKGKIVVS